MGQTKPSNTQSSFERHRLCSWQKLNKIKPYCPSQLNLEAEQFMFIVNIKQKQAQEYVFIVSVRKIDLFTSSFISIIM